jgi:REP element-mobilizing transposase RayT
MRSRMTEQAVVLNDSQRPVVERTIREVCQYRHWALHATNVRSNHVHIVLSAELPPDQVLSQLKAWCSRRLSEEAGLSAEQGSRNGRKRWWTEHGSTKWINDDNYLQNAIRYVNERQ